MDTNVLSNRNQPLIYYMEYLLFSLWVIAMAFMIGKSIFAYRSLQRTINGKNRIV